MQIEDLTIGQARELARELARMFGGLSETKREDGRYVIVRTYSAGVFAGEIESRSRQGQEVVLRNARRVWSWAGAATLSELAQRGTSKPSECKFPVPVDRVELMQAIEILDVTEAARKSIEGVPVWTR
jgi:hypothetical protein